MNGQEHWTTKKTADGQVRLFLWQKTGKSAKPRGTILFVHGSSMAGQPTFDLQVPGRPFSSVMDWFAERGFDTWCVDMEGYGRSDKKRAINCDIANGADDIEAASEYIAAKTGAKKLTVPTVILRGEFDGIAGTEDLLKFFARLPHPDKQFSVMQGISHASFQQKNYMLVYHLLHSFYTQPEPVYSA